MSFQCVPFNVQKQFGIENFFGGKNKLFPANFFPPIFSRQFLPAKFSRQIFPPNFPAKFIFLNLKR